MFKIITPHRKGVLAVFWTDLHIRPCAVSGRNKTMAKKTHESSFSWDTLYMVCFRIIKELWQSCRWAVGLEKLHVCDVFVFVVFETCLCAVSIKNIGSPQLEQIGIGGHGCLTSNQGHHDHEDHNRDHYDDGEGGDGEWG